VIILREMDLPEGVTAEQAVALALGAERAAEETIILLKGDVPTPTARPERVLDAQEGDHAQAPIEASTPEERGQSPLDLIRSLAGKCELDLDFTDAGITTTEKIGAPRPRTFRDVGECLATLKARVRVGNDLSRQQAREAEAVAKGEPEPVPVGRDYHAELAEMCRHYEIDCQLGPVITLAGKPFTKTFPRIEDACEFLRKRQF
jgi:hypothetical protein